MRKRTHEEIVYECVNSEYQIVSTHELSSTQFCDKYAIPAVGRMETLETAPQQRIAPQRCYSEENLDILQYNNTV